MNKSMATLARIVALPAAILLAGLAAAAQSPQSVKALLLWGGADAGGEPFLHPAFVIEAPPALPANMGDYRITGRSTAGDDLFAFSFTMPEIADGDGSSSFSFALPVEPAWGERLASITLTGPGGSSTLDTTSDRPMAILLNPETGRVRGIFRDPAPASEAAENAAESAANQNLLVLFSRGIPDAAAWGR